MRARRNSAGGDGVLNPRFPAEDGRNRYIKCVMPRMPHHVTQGLNNRRRVFDSNRAHALFEGDGPLYVVRSGIEISSVVLYGRVELIELIITGSRSSPGWDSGVPVGGQSNPPSTPNRLPR